MENLQINQGIKFLVSDGKGVIGTADPSGSQGISKGASETGFYIQSSVDYTLWFYDGSAWASHQSIDVSDANYSEGFAFAWNANTAAYIKTADASHEVYVFGRSGDLKVDSTPNDATQGADSVFDGTGSLSITSIDTQNDYTEGLSVSNDGTVTFDRTDNNSAYQLKFEGTNITIGKNGDDTITLTGGDGFTSPLTTDGDLFIQDGSADSRLGIGSDGQYLSVSSGSPAWVDLSSGDVSKVGTPANNQVAIWTGNGTLEGESSWTFNSSTFRSYIQSDFARLGTKNGAGTRYVEMRSTSPQLHIVDGSNYVQYMYNTIATGAGQDFKIQAAGSGAHYTYFDNTGGVGIGAGNSLGARLHVKGEGNTSATSAFVVKNSSNSTLFEIKDDGSMTGVLSYNSSGVAEFNTANQNTYAGSFYNGTVGVFGYVNNIAAGARASVIAGYGHDIDKYVDRANIFGNGNKVHASTDSSHASYASLGLKEGGTIIGSSNYGNGSGIQVIGVNSQVWGSNNFGTMSMALGNTINIGRSDTHAEDSFAFGKGLKMDGRLSGSNIKDVRNIMMIGYDFVANHAIHDENTKMILFGAGGARPTLAMMPDPDEHNLPLNLIMGSSHVAYHSGTAYPLQGGMGSGCFILHGEHNRTKAPSVDIPDAITMYAGDRSYDGINATVGGKGLIIKGENSGRTYISERIGINVEHNTAQYTQLTHDVEAGLHIFGEGNSDATSSVKVQNSDGNVAIEVLNDLVVVMPNLPTSSAGLPTGALYNDGGTVKVA